MYSSEVDLWGMLGIATNMYSSEVALWGMMGIAQLIHFYFNFYFQEE